MKRSIFKKASVGLCMLFGMLGTNLPEGKAQDKAPIVETYSNQNRVRSGMMLGGIGTGGMEIRKDGNFHKWSIFNNYPLGTGPLLTLPEKPFSNDANAFLFFVVRYQLEGKQPQIKLLQLSNDMATGGGTLTEAPEYYFPWLSTIDEIQYAARFPFADLTYSDDEMPFEIELEAFSPFIPHQVQQSSIPAIDFNFTITSKIEQPIDVCIVASLRNLVAYDVQEKYFKSAIREQADKKYFVHSVGNVAEDHITNGEMALGAFGGDEVSYYLGWEHRHPYYEYLLTDTKLRNINDTENRNTVNKEGQKIAWSGNGSDNQIMKSSVAVSKTLAPKQQAEAHFFMNWYFPNAMGAVHKMEAKGDKGFYGNETGYKLPIKHTERVGHYYENFYANVDDVVKYFTQNNAQLKADSKQFVDNMYAADVEQYILDQVNSQLNTFITSSQIDKKGRFAIREGLTENGSWGPFATADVGLYGSWAALALFPELQQNMMKAHRDAQTAQGEINHGLGADLSLNQNGTFGVHTRVDLVPNYIQLVLRDYLFTNDTTYLKEMWPSVKLGIDYVLNELDLTGDQMPDMHGIMCSYDNFPMHGLASYIVTQWVTAMKLSAIAANDLGDKKLAKKYESIANKGIKLVDKYLWNGEYYRLANDYKGDKGVDEGILTDQLVGQWIALEAGVGQLYPKEKVQSAMDQILSYSYIEQDYLRNCTWKEHPLYYPMADTDLWIDQANTPWTGVELAFAAFLIRQDRVEEGKQIIKSINDRYRESGLYWNHQEFGGHYYRPMGAWTILNALSGFTLVKDAYTFNPTTKKEEFTMFFSANTGTGHLKVKKDKVELEVLSGTLQIASIQIPAKYLTNHTHLVLDEKETISCSWKKEEGMKKALFKQALQLKKGSVLTFQTEEL